jgi:nucleotide-binding universal stress UspA family protein
MYSKVLLAIDGSDNAWRAVEKVISMAKEGNASEIVAFYSIQHRTPLQMPLQQVYETNYYTLIMKGMEEAGKQLIETTQAKFDNEGIPVEARLITDVAPEEYIKSAVENEGFDLVVLGCRGHHSLMREIFLGTVPTRVLHTAPCDVLVVR